jgi:hypothetical protein
VACNSSLGQVRPVDYLNSRNSFPSRFTGAPREQKEEEERRRRRYTTSQRSRRLFGLGLGVIPPRPGVIARNCSLNFQFEVIKLRYCT